MLSRLLSSGHAATYHHMLKKTSLTGTAFHSLEIPHVPCNGKPARGLAKRLLAGVAEGRLTYPPRAAILSFRQL